GSVGRYRHGERFQGSDPYYSYSEVFNHKQAQQTTEHGTIGLFVTRENSIVVLDGDTDTFEDTDIFQDCKQYGAPIAWSVSRRCHIPLWIPDKTKLIPHKYLILVDGGGFEVLSTHASKLVATTHDWINEGVTLGTRDDTDFLNSLLIKYPTVSSAFAGKRGAGGEYTRLTRDEWPSEPIDDAQCDVDDVVDLLRRMNPAGAEREQAASQGREPISAGDAFDGVAIEKLATKWPGEGGEEYDYSWAIYNWVGAYLWARGFDPTGIEDAALESGSYAAQIGSTGDTDAEHKLEYAVGAQLGNFFSGERGKRHGALKTTIDPHAPIPSAGAMLGGSTDSDGYDDPATVAPPPADTPTTGTGDKLHAHETEQPVEGKEMVASSEALAQFFNNCTYIACGNRVLIPNGALLKPDEFKHFYSGPQFRVKPPSDDTKPYSDDAFKALTQNAVFQRPKAHETSFRPDKEPFEIRTESGVKKVNRFIPAWGTSLEGDVWPMLNHLGMLFPRDQDSKPLIDFQSNLIQFPGRKAGWMPVIYSPPGTGKSLIILECMRFLVGSHSGRYCHEVRPADLIKNFNAWTEGNILAYIEEMSTRDKYEINDNLKRLITNYSTAIEQKGIDQKTAWNCLNLIAFTNRMDGVIKSRDDRRIFFVWTEQRTRADVLACFSRDYWTNLFNWRENGGREAWAYYCKHKNVITTPMERDAPQPSMYEESIKAGLNKLERAIDEAIMHGEPGFTGGLICPGVLNDWLVRLSPNHKPHLSSDYLENLGFIMHPTFKGDKRLRRNVQSPSMPHTFPRQTIWVSTNGEFTELLNMQNPNDVVAKYCEEYEKSTTVDNS
ncbi:MAG: hypothetical protein KAJ19_26305, partial [Gammaproteobacteria bacterium]|nr:hypothetical protein [Gammaproteobacteria bacterium]